MASLWLQRPCLTATASSRVTRCNSLLNSQTRQFTRSAIRHDFKLSDPPHPAWQYGEGLPAHETQWKQDMEQPRKIWDMDETGPIDTYKLLTTAIVPRPIGFVSTLAADGTRNLAPMSYFSMVSSNPPLVSLSFSLGRARPKDTRENILATKEFTVNIISEPFVEAANSTSVEAPAEVDEWLVSGLTAEPSIAVKPALVKESAVALECELYSHQDILNPHPTTTIVLGRVKKVHVRPSVLDDDGKTVDIAKLRPVSRLGGLTYAKVTEGFDLPRLLWKGETKEEILKTIEKQQS